MVSFIIANKKNIAIKLFEYARNNPVKGYHNIYELLIQDKNGERYKLRASNWESDRLSFSDSEYEKDISYAEKMHDILLSGGKIKFVIRDVETPTTIYNFTIDNADWYENAYIKLNVKE